MLSTYLRLVLRLSLRARGVVLVVVAAVPVGWRCPDFLVVVWAGLGCCPGFR